MYPIANWSMDVNVAVNQAIADFNLRNLGWRGFENLQWTLKLKAQYPEIEAIAQHASSILGSSLSEVTALFSSVEVEDRLLVRSYFTGKLALEKLSCDRSGAAGGMCDKFGAYLQIFELTRDVV